MGSAFLQESGSPEDEDGKIYFFFSETGKEFDFFEDTVVSRVARVCKVRGIGGGSQNLLAPLVPFCPLPLQCQAGCGVLSRLATLSAERQPGRHPLEDTQAPSRENSTPASGTRTESFQSTIGGGSSGAPPEGAFHLQPVGGQQAADRKRPLLLLLGRLQGSREVQPWGETRETLFRLRLLASESCVQGSVWGPFYLPFLIDGTR